MPFVLDASIALSWRFADESNEYGEHVLDSLAEDHAIVPSIWSLEFVNGLIVAERRGRVTKAQVTRSCRSILKLPIRMRPSTLDETFGAVVELARAHTLSAYDASYLELSLREGLAIATKDTALRSAAKRAGVAIYLER